MSIDRASLIAEVAQIAVMPGTAVQRAEALLVPLRRLTAFDAVSITVLDPRIERSQPLVRRGYPERVQRYLDSPEFLGDMEMLTARVSPRPVMRLKDVPVPLHELELWAEYLQPAGFGEGLGVPLFTPDDRLLGYVSTQSSDPRPPSEEACDLLVAIAPFITAAVDPMTTVAVLSRVVADAVAGAVVSDHGEVQTLAGRPDHRLLAAGSPVLAEATAQLTHGAAMAVFLAPDPGAELPLLRVTVLACSSLPPGHLRAVVLLSPPGELCGLTQRELEILGLLVRGDSAARIAAALIIDERAVLGHVDEIRTKLGVPSRTAAGVRALRQGLYVPASLHRATQPMSG